MTPSTDKTGQGVLTTTTGAGGTVVTADARKVSPVDFWRELNADRYAKREADAAWAAEYEAARDAGDIAKCGDMLREAALRAAGIGKATHVLTDRVIGRAA